MYGTRVGASPFGGSHAASRSLVVRLCDQSSLATSGVACVVVCCAAAVVCCRVAVVSTVSVPVWEGACLLSADATATAVVASRFAVGGRVNPVLWHPY